MSRAGWIRKRTSFLVALVGVLAFTSTVPANVFALDEFFYSSNNILFFNPDDTCGSGTTSASFGSVSLEKSETLEKIFKGLNDRSFNAGQAAAIMGNMYAESGFNSDAHEAGNDIGYGLVQWSFGRRTNLESFAASKSLPPSDVGVQLDFIKKEYDETYKVRLGKTAFADGRDIPAATRAFMEIYEAPFDDGSNDPAAVTSKRIPAAVKVYELYKNLTSSIQTSNTTTNCLSGNGVVAGNLSETAVNFALTSPASEGMNKRSDARDTYISAHDQYNPSVDLTDCGGYIATAMYASGVDTSYPNVLVSAQLEYTKANPEKYLIIENITNVADLRAGDILFINGHTTMYTGPGTYSSVDASLAVNIAGLEPNGRVPSVRDSGSALYMLGKNATVARVIK